LGKPISAFLAFSSSLRLCSALAQHQRGTLPEVAAAFLAGATLSIRRAPRSTALTRSTPVKPRFPLQEEEGIEVAFRFKGNTVVLPQERSRAEDIRSRPVLAVQDVQE
jgi:hypothetical protein